MKFKKLSAFIFVSNVLFSITNFALAVDGAKPLPYFDNCVALSFSKTLGTPQGSYVKELISNDIIASWIQLEDDNTVKSVLEDTSLRTWSPVIQNGGTWADIKEEIKSLCQYEKKKFFAIHWGRQDGERWGIPNMTFHAISITATGKNLTVHGNNGDIFGGSHKEGHYQRNEMRDSDWVSAWYVAE